jgi:DNA topoisomerase-1
MRIAQKLYEGVDLGQLGTVGLITYMRTDSFRVAPEAQQWARNFISRRFGKEFLPERSPHYRSKASAQEAHEAIRPTQASRSPESVENYLEPDAGSLGPADCSFRRGRGSPRQD